MAAKDDLLKMKQTLKNSKNAGSATPRNSSGNIEAKLAYAKASPGAKASAKTGPKVGSKTGVAPGRAKVGSKTGVAGTRKGIGTVGKGKLPGTGGVYKTLPYNEKPKSRTGGVYKALPYNK